MLDSIFEVIFLIGLILYLFGVYGPSALQYKKRRIADNRMRRLDIFLDGFTYLGWQVIPVIYVLTSWLDYANYSLPVWAGWIGVVLFAATLFLMWKAYSDLGRNWSPTLQITENHLLVMKGIYQYIRHPIYAGLWLWGIAQPLLLQNWIAGLGLLVTFFPLYFLRVPYEEKMMHETFGKEYQEYVEKTGRVIPRFWK